jgi:hypothetical protein
MTLPRKRTVVAWATIGILSADVAQSAFRLALCSSTPETDQPSICRESPITVAVIAAKIRALLSVWSQLESPPLPVTKDLSPEGTRLQQPINAKEF